MLRREQLNNARQPHCVDIRRRGKLVCVSAQHAFTSLLASSGNWLKNIPRSAAILIVLCGGAAAEELRDPTRPHTFKAERMAVEGVPSFSVNAIFVSDVRKLAIINGARVRIGDTVSGAEVVDIESDKVTLSVSGKQFIARLKTRRP